MTNVRNSLPFCQLHKREWLELVESLAIVIIISSLTAQARYMPHVRNRCADKENLIRRRVSYHRRLCMGHCIRDQLVIGQRDIIFFENKDRFSPIYA